MGKQAARGRNCVGNYAKVEGCHWQAELPHWSQSPMRFFHQMTVSTQPYSSNSTKDWQPTRWAWTRNQERGYLRISKWISRRIGFQWSYCHRIATSNCWFDREAEGHVPIVTCMNSHVVYQLPHRRESCHRVHKDEGAEHSLRTGGSLYILTRR